MLIILLSVVVAIMLFLCAFIGFKEGVRLGMQSAKGIEPVKIRSPIKLVKDIKLEHDQSKEEKKYQADFEKLMSYTGEIENEE